MRHYVFYDHREQRWDDWTAGARHGTTVIDDPGKPFRTTSGDTADGPVPGLTTATWDPVSARRTTSPR